MSDPVGARERQESVIVRWLSLFLQEGQVTELRALHAPTWKIRSNFYHANQLHGLARKATEWEREGAKGVYFIPNPLREEMLWAVRCANDDDVVRRRWLLIDIDSERADTKQPATDDERKASWEVATRVKELLVPEGLGDPIVGDSGNGWHLCYAADLPNDEPARLWHRGLLRWLRDECESHPATRGKGIVDVSTHNASRIWKLYGTKSQKGDHTKDRPHRWSRLVERNGQEG